MRMPADILIKAFLGGLLIAVLLTLARRGQYLITGLLISVPAVSLYTWWWIGREEGAEALRAALRAAMWSAVPWVMYLLVVYLLAGRLPLWLSLGCGVAAYLAATALFYLLLSARG